MNFSDFQRKNITPQDMGVVAGNEDPNFDMERHNRLMKGIVENNARVSRDKRREYDKGIEERSHAATQYIAHLKDGGEENVKKYFGSYLDNLKMQDVANKYKMAWSDEKKKSQGQKAFISHIKSAGDV